MARQGLTFTLLETRGSASQARGMVVLGTLLNCAGTFLQLVLGATRTNLPPRRLEQTKNASLSLSKRVQAVTCVNELDKLFEKQIEATNQVFGTPTCHMFMPKVPRCPACPFLWARPLGSSEAGLVWLQQTVSLTAVRSRGGKRGGRRKPRGA